MCDAWNQFPKFLNLKLISESLKGKVRKEKGANQGSRSDMIIVGQEETGFK
jgi:hypothetical protein